MPSPVPCSVLDFIISTQEYRLPCELVLDPKVLFMTYCLSSIAFTLCDIILCRSVNHTCVYILNHVSGVSWFLL